MGRLRLLTIGSALGLRFRARAADATSGRMDPDAGFDSTLLAARAGAEWAWRSLYLNLAPALTRFARASRVGDPENVVGDVFLRAVGAIGRFEGDARAFRTWMFTMLRNAIIDEQRKVARRRTEPIPAEVLAELGPTGDAEQEAMRELAERRVRVALAGLTHEQRDVLLLRILGDLTVKEAAAVLGKRPGAIKAAQARGIERIRRAIAAGAVTL